MTKKQQLALIEILEKRIEEFEWEEDYENFVKQLEKVLDKVVNNKPLSIVPYGDIDFIKDQNDMIFETYVMHGELKNEYHCVERFLNKYKGVK